MKFFYTTIVFLIVINLLHAQEYIATRYFGGDSLDLGTDITIDSEDNVFITGNFTREVNFAEDFMGDATWESQGESDIAIIKLDNGLNFEWAKVIGGVGFESLSSVTSDQVGNVYVSGDFGPNVNFGQDFGLEDIRGTEPGFTSGSFIMKMNSDGSYIWTKEIKGGNANITVLETDNENNLYIGGYFRGDCDFRIEFDGISEIRSSFGWDVAFVTKVNEDGSYGWTKIFPTIPPGRCFIFDLAIGNSGNVYITGMFDGGAGINMGHDFGEQDTLFGAGQLRDIFITKINGDLSYGWARRIGGEGLDAGYGLEIDSSENVYVSGWFQGAVDFSEDFNGVENDTFNTNRISGTFSSITKLTDMGSYEWTRVLGSTASSGFSFGSDLKIDQDKLLFIGDFADTIPLNNFFPETQDSLISAGGQDEYVLRLDLDGNYFWSRRIGGPSNEGVPWLDLKDGEAFIVSTFFGEANFSEDFDGANPDIKESNGRGDIFLTKILLDGVSTVSNGFEVDTGKIQIYPNPTDGIIQIASEAGLEPLNAYTLYNALGEEINSKKFQGSLAFFHTLNFSLSPSGVYYLKLHLEGGGTVSKKLIIQK